MGDLQRSSLVERDIDQVITSLKKGAYLLKYGRRGKPKFCPFRLSTDESKLIWYYDKDEKQLELQQVSRIEPGQRTPIFLLYPRPEYEYQSFSLIYNNRSLDLIRKDKDEAEAWFVGLKALIARGSNKKLRNEVPSECALSDHPQGQRVIPSSSDTGDTQRAENISQNRMGKAFADIVSYTAVAKSTQSVSMTYSPILLSPGAVDDSNASQTSGCDTFRLSLSSAVSSSRQGSCMEDFNGLRDVFIWGESSGDGVVGCGLAKGDNSIDIKVDTLLPKALESTMVLDVNSIACCHRHAVLVTKQGEMLSWGEEVGGRLGHGPEADTSQPKLVEALCRMRIGMVACGVYHTCVACIILVPLHFLVIYVLGVMVLLAMVCSVTEARQVTGSQKKWVAIEGVQVSYISCGPWHTAILTYAGRLFTFGDGTFGALGHGNRCGTNIPREVGALKGSRTIRVVCGVWHTAAIVEVTSQSSNSRQSDISLSGKPFTWGNGDKGRLGHVENVPRLVPESISSLADTNFSRVACGNKLTVALTSSGRVYSMGSPANGQLGVPRTDEKTPTCIKVRRSYNQISTC